jgi:two-component system invasion response regulator UvrY
MSIRVLLVDDHELIRTCLTKLLEADCGIQVIGSADSGEEAIVMVAQFTPDVVLMDIDMPGIGGIEASKRIHNRFPGIKIIALSVYSDGPFAKQLFNVGGSGYISKNCRTQDLIRAISSVHSGNCYLSTDMGGHLLKTHGLGSSENDPFEQLSPREMQIVGYIMQGKFIQEISALLYLSPKTVNTYRYRAHKKLGVKNDVELTRMAVKYRVIKEPQGKYEVALNS